MNPGNAKAQRKRSGPGGRGNRTRATTDKSLLNEGIYCNPRFMNITTSLIGCEVQVTVRNGSIYEGVFKTLSPQFNVVLDMAHKVEEGSPNSIPSRDRIIDTVMFQIRDVLMISALSVDLDFACKDAFTDSAISKFNGQITERELQPWEGDAGEEGIELESGELASSPLDTGGGVVTSIVGGVSASVAGGISGGISGSSANNKNGWDPNDMFKTNAERFDVKSSYDPSLAQYTTPLKQENTKEYKDREANAARLAQEIEGSATYNARIELENGDDNEEEKFSAVIRPGDGSANGSSRYVPPHLRKNPQQGRAVKAGPVPGGRPHRDSQSPSSQPSPTSVSPQPETKYNGDKEEKAEVEKAPTTTAEVSAATVVEKPDPKEHSPSYRQGEPRKNSNTKAPRDTKMIQELKEFSTNFKVKLSTEDSKPPQPANSHGRPDGQATTPHQPAHPADKVEQDDKKDVEEKKLDDTLKKSTLNPNAKEFILNPNAKPFTPKQPMQVPTPPRPQTQSPVVVPQQHIAMQPPMYQHPPYMVPGTMPPTVNQQQPRFTKRAVVSVQPRQEFSPAAQAAAATGQPLLAQPAITQPQPQYAVQYMPHVAGPGPQIQVVPMHGTRMMTAHLQQQGPLAPPAEQPAGQQQPPPHQTMFMSPPGQAGQMPPQHHTHHIHHGGTGGHAPTPTHIGPHHQPTPPHSQPSHMNAAASAQAGQHAPSPVQQHHPPPPPPPQQQPGHPLQGMPPQGHPGTSATPQPHLIYQQQQQMSQPGGHPPLQPSPHTPTSPQSMYPPTLSFAPAYSYSTQAAMQAVPQMTYAHTTPHTTVTHAQHQQHQHLPHPPQGPQIVMMHNPAQHQGQMHGQHTPQPQHNVMQHAHMQGHPMQGPIHGQAGPPPMMTPQTINVTQGNVHHPQMHYVHQHMVNQAGVPSAGGGSPRGPPPPTAPPPTQPYHHAHGGL